MQDPIARLLGPWSEELNSCSILFRILLTCMMAAAIGCERSSKRHSAGLRTFMTVSLAANVAMFLDLYLCSQRESPLLLLSCAAVLSISILCVHSLLFSSKSQIKGLTTAASLWACGMIGLAAGAGLYLASVISFLALLCCLSGLPAAERYLKNRSNHFEIHLELKSSKYLTYFVSTIRRLGLSIDEIEKNTAYTGSGLSVYSIAISIKSKELKQFKTHTEIIEALKSLDYVYHVEEMLP